MTPLQRQTLVNAIDEQLPQTQCRRCGYCDCLHYAQAIADGIAGINRCQPGGAEGIVRLAQVTRHPVEPLSPEVGPEAPRMLAVIDESWCIGCTKCIQACPVDAIMGAPKLMHIVIEAHCTGCELCLPVCPVDCIELAASSTQTPAPTGWGTWSEEQAQSARQRYQQHEMRVERWRRENKERLFFEGQKKLAHLEENPQAVSKISDSHTLERKHALIERVLAKAREQQIE